MNDLISIILPVYNGEKYMRESIESCINQTYINWELIIIDDCSIDNTPLIAKEYMEKDSRIKYYKNLRNMKLPTTLNNGFSHAKGDFLTWTSDDNIFDRNALDRMINYLKKEKVSFVFASCYVIDYKGVIIESIKTTGNYKKEIFGQNIIGACFMYSREVYEIIGEYDPTLFLVEDYDYWLRIFARFKVGHIDEYLYYYRWHDGALTSTEKKEIHYQACEKMILKNIPNFAKLDYESKYHLYRGLHVRRALKKDNKEKNKYKKKYYYYKIWYYLFINIPNYIKNNGFIGVIKKLIKI